MTKYYYNTRTKKFGVFKDNSYYGTKFQRFVNKCPDKLLYSLNKDVVRVLQIAHCINELNIQKPIDNINFRDTNT